MTKLRKVQHLRSSVQGKYPTLDQVEYGEITVNFYQGDEFLCIRNKGVAGDGSDDAIVSFRTWPYIQKIIEDNELVTAAALTTIKESCGFNSNGEYTPSSTSTYISGSTTVTEALDTLDKNLALTYTKAEVDSLIPTDYATSENISNLQSEITSVSQTANEALNTANQKQDPLTAGEGIEITSGNVISCTLDTSLYSVVTSLPTTGEANKIYLIKSTESGDTQNIYIEYAYVNSAWEKLGEYKAEIDLTPYLTKTEATNTYATITTVTENEKVTAAALTALNESCGFSENAEFIPSSTAQYISGATTVTEALDTLDSVIPKQASLEGWETISYPSQQATNISENNINYLLANYNTELALTFAIESAGQTYTSKCIAKAKTNNSYRFRFIVGDYLLALIIEDGGVASDINFVAL